MNKAVITGIGCVSGLGADVPSTWESLIAGKGAIQPKIIEVIPDPKIEERKAK